MNELTISAFRRALKVLEILFSEKGCPWDREQTVSSLMKNLQEETLELVQALEKKDLPNTREEIGDVLWVLLMMTQAAERDGLFTLNEVIEEAINKMIRRHPHVFKDDKAQTADEAIHFFNMMKNQE